MTVPPSQDHYCWYPKLRNILPSSQQFSGIHFHTSAFYGHPSPQADYNGNWTFYPLAISLPRRFAPCLDASPPGCFAPGRFSLWMIRPIQVDVSPRTFRPKLSVLGVSPSRCGRTDGRFDVKPLALASEVKSCLLYTSDAADE